MDLLGKMVRVIEELSKLNVPVVFKGAVVLKFALSGVNCGTNRETKDVDGDWVGGAPSMRRLTELINSAVSQVEPGMYAIPYREYGNGKSAGYKILNPDGTLCFKLDMSIKANPFYCSYVTVNGISFVGATPQKMFADKLHGVSARKIFRRAKDIYDLYLLSDLVGYSTLDIYAILNAVGRNLGLFEEFKTRYSDLEHAYNALSGVVNKPDFSVVYNRVACFIQPFMSGLNDNLSWNGNNWVK